MEKYNNHSKKLNRQNNRNDQAWTKERTYTGKKQNKKKIRAPGTAGSVQKTLNLCGKS